MQEAAIMGSQDIDEETDFGDMPEFNENDTDIKNKLKMSMQVDNGSIFIDA